MLFVSNPVITGSPISSETLYFVNGESADERSEFFLDLNESYISDELDVLLHQNYSEHQSKVGVILKLGNVAFI